MATRALSMLLAAAVLSGASNPATSQTQREYEAFIRSEINKCVAEAVRLDKETGALNHPTAPTQAERVASCRELVTQVNDLYPMTEPQKTEPKKRTR